MPELVYLGSDDIWGDPEDEIDRTRHFHSRRLQTREKTMLKYVVAFLGLCIIFAIFEANSHGLLKLDTDLSPTNASKDKKDSFFVRKDFDENVIDILGND